MEATGSSTENVPMVEAAATEGLRVDRMICLGLAILTLLVFKQTLSFGFVNFDDDVYVYENPDVANGVTWHGLATAFSQGSHANWDPLTTISHMVDCQLFGLQPGGHHLTNVLLHTATVVLLFRLLLALTAARWPSAFAAALFAIHPLHVESVAWVTERKDVLSGLFFVLTIGAYVRYVRGPRQTVNYLLLLLLFALGLMSKAMLVTSPFILLLLDYWPLKRFDHSHGTGAKTKSLIVEKVPLLLLAIISTVAAAWAQSSVQAVQSLQQFPFTTRAANALNSVVTYLAQTVVPVNLAVYYPYPLQGFKFGQVAAAFIIVAGITAAVWRWRRARPYLLVGWLWYLLMLVPVIGLVQLGQQAHADRYTYLPQIGLGIPVSWWVASLLKEWPGRRLFFGITGSVAVTALGLSATGQASVWQNSLSLWEHCLAVTSNNMLAHYNYGLALVQAGRPAEGVPQFQKALELQPDNFGARRNLGSALFQTGDFDDAVIQLRRALEIEPSNAPAHLTLGNAYFQQKQTNAAISEYQMALKLDPDFADAENTLGFVLLKSGKPDDAVTHLNRALKLQPGLVNAWYNLGTAERQLSRTNAAIEKFKHAIQLQPNFTAAQMSLNEIAWCMAVSPVPAERNGGAALDLANGLVQLTQGTQPIFLRTLAAAFAETGKFADAISAAEAALELAQRANDAALAAQLREQLAAYRGNRPYRDAEATTRPGSN